MSPEDRRRARSEPRVFGERATDPTLTTSAAASRLGVGTDFIVGEIRDGRLVALVIRRPGYRSVYRIAPADLDAYLTRYGWRHAAQTG